MQAAALVDIVFMDISRVVVVRRFWKADRLSGVILVPYLLWIFFATYLNSGFYMLN